MPKHITIQAHLLVDDTIHNPHELGRRTAGKVLKFIEDMYKKKDGKRQVTVPVVSSILADVAETDE